MCISEELNGFLAFMATKFNGWKICKIANLVGLYQRLLKLQGYG